jgi:hypothetical protein
MSSGADGGEEGVAKETRPYGTVKRHCALRKSTKKKILTRTALLHVVDNNYSVGCGEGRAACGP